MKHLKTYEKIFNKFNVGDYMLMKTEYLIHLSEFFADKYQGYVQILEINPNSFNKYDSKTTKNIILSLHEDMIERKLNKKEIETYKQQLEASKYNL